MEHGSQDIKAMLVADDLGSQVVEYLVWYPKYRLLVKCRKWNAGV